MNYDKILAALEKRVLDLQNVPSIAWENVKYTPTTGTPYIQTRFMPIDRRSPFIGLDTDGKHFSQRYVGIFQLNLYYPESRGQKPTNTIVNEICDKFDAGTDLSHDGVYVTISQTERMRGINESPWFITPVNVHWYSYAK